MNFSTTERQNRHSKHHKTSGVSNAKRSQAVSDYWQLDCLFIRPYYLLNSLFKNVERESVEVNADKLFKSKIKLNRNLP